MKSSGVFSLSRRVALVTGAGQGVGAEIALTLAAHGARVAVNDLVAERAASVAESINEAGGEAIPVRADVCDFAATIAMNETVAARLGTIDILVNNAGNAGSTGAQPRISFWETEPEDWLPYIQVNLLGAMNCARAVTPAMIQQRHGRIITIVSDAGRNGEAGYEAYSAAKAGAAGLSRALARSLGRYSITANTISLGNIAAPHDDFFSSNPKALARMLSHYIIRRQGTPSDVAPIALLLASDEGGWITGQNYPVNGGFTLAL